jgi:hypothetical protein
VPGKGAHWSISAVAHMKVRITSVQVMRCSASCLELVGCFNGCTLSWRVHGREIQTMASENLPEGLSCSRWSREGKVQEWLPVVVEPARLVSWLSCTWEPTLVLCILFGLVCCSKLVIGYQQFTDLVWLACTLIRDLISSNIEMRWSRGVHPGTWVCVRVRNPFN